MERADSPQNRARVIIVSQRARGRGGAATRSTSSTTLSLMPRWTSDRAADAAAKTLRSMERGTRGVPPAS
jgi:hypothetical protein